MCFTVLTVGSDQVIFFKEKWIMLTYFVKEMVMKLKHKISLGIRYYARYPRRS